MNKCPKCHQDVLQSEEICPHCGIVFAKYYRYHDNPSQQQESSRIIISKNNTPGLLHRLFEEDAYRHSHAAFWGRCLLLPVFLIWSWLLITPSIASNAAGVSFLHNVNLPFHETGHIVFRPFGAFMTSLGGTLGQLLMPSICMMVLLLQTRDPYGASFALWWIGENFLDIAPYINDARAGQLPLLGGNTGETSPYGFHDWSYILNESGFLQHDHTLAKLSHFTGSVLMLAALIICGYLLFKQRQAWSDSVINRN